MTDSVKGLSQVHEASVNVAILFLILPLTLPYSKYYINRSTALLEVVLTLQQQILLEVSCLVVQQVCSQDLPVIESREMPLWLSQALLFPFHL